MNHLKEVVPMDIMLVMISVIEPIRVRMPHHKLKWEIPNKEVEA
ncbi:unnamed protein product [marine sediment metagenome]|uniref:Uncharacterized protein n=1 Tax=marine sediment metagenome TaxID=412755 RepID=X0VN27_9ZZZZ